MTKKDKFEFEDETEVGNSNESDKDSDIIVSADDYSLNICQGSNDNDFQTEDDDYVPNEKSQVSEESSNDEPDQVHTSMKKS